MRTVEEIKADIEACSCSGTQQRLDDLWLEWFRCVAYQVQPDRLREMCEAERSGRYVVMPCKVGDTVYWAERLCGVHVHEGTVISFCFDKKALWMYVRYKDGLSYHHKTDAYFNKAIFFTRAEAEAVMSPKCKWLDGDLCKHLENANDDGSPGWCIKGPCDKEAALEKERNDIKNGKNSSV